MDLDRPASRNFLRHLGFVIGHSSFLPRFLVGGVLAFLPAKLLQLKAVGTARFFLGAVIAAAAYGAFQPNVFAHDSKVLNWMVPGPARKAGPGTSVRFRRVTPES